ncbi:MAG: 3',5'-cyclic AMP phosphodiesterase CpdA [Verrucomicrobiales bacterium]|jgi:3',5'-cyclic AMP phosphodiesterase CpdA
MASWLENDLASTTQEWIFAFWHHPPYTKGSHNSDIEINLVQMRESFLPILESYCVDLVLGGHSHSGRLAPAPQRLEKGRKRS